MKPTILIVDDDELICELYSDYFKQNGYITKTAISVDRAVKSVREQAPDIILSDFVMPIKNGINLFRELQAFAPNIPFVFMTGYQHDPKVIQQLEEINASWISKPAALEELLEKVNSELNQHQATRT